MKISLQDQLCLAFSEMAETLRRKYKFNRPDGPQCKTCLRRFSSNKSLRQHMERIHNRENRVDRFECDTCHRRFSQKSNLTVPRAHRSFEGAALLLRRLRPSVRPERHRDRHVRMMHDNIRSAACFHCGKTFCSDSALMHHTRRVHYKEKYAHPRPCSECDFVAQFPSHLRRHFYARHTKILFFFFFDALGADFTLAGSPDWLLWFGLSSPGSRADVVLGISSGKRSRVKRVWWQWQWK
jgi:hypothetical protein